MKPRKTTIKAKKGASIAKTLPVVPGSMYACAVRGIEKIKRAIEKSYKVSFDIYENFYGEGNASKKIIESLMEY